MDDRAPLPQPPIFNLNAYSPAEIKEAIEKVGVKKANLPLLASFMLAMVAGGSVGLGALYYTIVASDAGLSFAISRVVGGLAFSLGLVLVLVGGAELFTGNNLIVMAWASRRVSTLRLLRNWAIVYAGNFVGAIATAALLYAAKQYEFGKGAVGDTALTIAATKTGYGWGQALVLGALCNALVCIAVWLCYSARTTADKVLAIIPPIAAFVASGFEHSVANMYFIPYGLFVKSNEAFVSSQKGLPDLSNLTWSNFLWANLVPVTIGNIVGGAVMVGAVYWFVYLRPRMPGRQAPAGQSPAPPA
jgi:formate transporter